MRFPSTRVGVTIAILFLFAGCVSGGPGTGATTATGTATSASTATPVPDHTDTPDSNPSTDATDATDSTPVSTGFLSAADRPDPDHEIHLYNDRTTGAEIHVRVVRGATNETVHDRSYLLDPGVDRTVYNTNSTGPDGIESFSVALTSDGATENVTIRTSECYGDVIGGVSESGSLQATYSIC